MAVIPSAAMTAEFTCPKTSSTAASNTSMGWPPGVGAALMTKGGARRAGADRGRCSHPRHHPDGDRHCGRDAAESKAVAWRLAL